MSSSRAPLLAEWREATSEHFIVYSDGSEKSLRKAATDLEKFDFMLRTMAQASGAKLNPAKPMKLKVYLMSTIADVQQALPVGGGGVLGFYDGTVRGPYAVSLRQDNKDWGLRGQQVLFHEYAHHFMLQNFPAVYPPWYAEGFAEYYGATKILDNDVIEVGHAADGRHSSFYDARWIPLHKLLAAKSLADTDGKGDLLYAQGWLLVHYFFTQAGRAGQLKAYLDAINNGNSYKAAMDQAFGPGAAELDRELRKYAQRQRLMTLTLPFKQIDIGHIGVRPLRPAEEALFRSEIELSAGILSKDAKRFVSHVRNRAERYPSDPFALAVLTEAERLAGNNQDAMAAVDRWLALKPSEARALMHKGELMIEALTGANPNKAAWEAARRLIFDAHRLNPRDPLILAAYYNSFLSEGVVPPPGAQNGLVRAFELVPQDDDLRYQLAHDFEQRGMVADAIAVIRPAAFELHGEGEELTRTKRMREKFERIYRIAGEEKRETAREMLDRLEKRLSDGATAAKSANDK